MSHQEHTEVVQSYEQLADARWARADRIRARATAVDLEPLRIAMHRRAAELELTATALQEIARGQRFHPAA